MKMSEYKQISIPVSPAIKRMDYPKWFGGSASCMAVVVSHPLDLSESSR
jgi:dicarboxylate transporter 10